MSWYFFGGFSEYAIVPSARVVNHCGCSVTHGWSGEAFNARSSAISSPRLLAVATNASKSCIVPRSGWIASWPPSAEPIAHGTPGSPGSGFSVLFLPLRKVLPIGCTGGMYTTSKPIAAIAGRRLAAVANVPDLGGSSDAPSERGKNSYHDPYKARSRSTHSG